MVRGEAPGRQDAGELPLHRRKVFGGQVTDWSISRCSCAQFKVTNVKV